MSQQKITSPTTSLQVAHRLERPIGVREVMGSIPVGDSDLFFVPRSWQTKYSIFLSLLYYIEVGRQTDTVDESKETQFEEAQLQLKKNSMLHSNGYFNFWSTCQEIKFINDPLPSL